MVSGVCCPLWRGVRLMLWRGSSFSLMEEFQHGSRGSRCGCGELVCQQYNEESGCGSSTLFWRDP